MQAFTIVAKFEGSGVSVTFTESESEKSEEGIKTKIAKSYGKDFKTRGAAAEGIEIQFRRYLKSLGAPPPEQLELKSQPAASKKSAGKKKTHKLSVAPPPPAEEKSEEK